MKLMKKLGLMLVILLLAGTVGTAGAATYDLIDDRDIALLSNGNRDSWEFNLSDYTNIESVSLIIWASDIDDDSNWSTFEVAFERLIVSVNGSFLDYMRDGDGAIWNDISSYLNEGPLTITVELETITNITGYSFDGVTATKAKLTIEGEKTSDPQDPVPVPGSILLLASGLTALLGFRRRLS